METDFLRKNKTADINQLCIALAKSAGAVKKKLSELKVGGIPISKGPVKNKRSRIGKRADLGIFYRSSWESNFHRYIKHLEPQALIKYEPKTYIFTPFGVVRGQLSYTPDFSIVFPDGRQVLIELKGYFSRQDITKLRRFKKFYPEDWGRLRAVVASPKVAAAKVCEDLGLGIFAYYKDLNSTYRSTIAHWE